MKNENDDLAQINHATLAGLLADEIGSGAYSVGDRYPTELELQQRFGIGRHTVREALKALTEKGLLGRRRKTGTVILSKKPVSEQVHSIRNIHGLLDFAVNTIFVAKYEGFVSNLSQAVIGFDEGVGERWYRIAGLRSWRNQARSLCWSEIIVPEEYATDRKSMRTDERPIYEHVMQAHKLKLGYVEQDISAVELPEWMAVMLDAKPYSPALLLKRRYVATSGTTFEVSHNYYPNDRYRVRNVMRQRE
jgi:DNA-binding GntR family transcriptional regulator